MTTQPDNIEKVDVFVRAYNGVSCSSRWQIGAFRNISVHFKPADDGVCEYVFQMQ